MNTSFDAMDMFFKTNKTNRTTTKSLVNRGSRKRRANSDSELTFMENEKTYFNNHLVTMPNDDINIDIMADANSDNTVLSDNTAMDPSQMFIIFTNPQEVFTCTPPQNMLNINSSTTVTNTHANIDFVEEPNSLFQTQIYLLNSGLHSGNIQTDLTDEQVNGLYAIQGAKDLSTNLPTGNHIPAKFLKQKLPSQLTSKAVPSQVDTENGKDCVNQQWITMKEDKAELREKGCKWKTGTWSNDEEELLRNNIDEYCKKHNITDPTPTIYSTQKEERKPFYRSIATGLNRPLFAVYRKVLRMYDRKNYVGKYTDEELKKLEQLCQSYKNNWCAIGLVLGRSASSVKDRARLLKCNRKTGKWESEELELLSSIIREMTNTKKGESVTVGINWTDVADRISTRNEKQCRTKWLNYLNWKEAGGKAWLKTDEIELIDRIGKTEVTDESQLDWNELSNGWASVRSPQWLRSKWWSIKKHCPGYQVSSFSDVLKYVQTVYIEENWEKLKRASQSDESLLQRIADMRANTVNDQNADITHNVADGNGVTSLQVTLSDPLINRNFDASNTHLENTYELQGLQFQLHLTTDHAQPLFHVNPSVASSETTTSTLSDVSYNGSLSTAHEDYEISVAHSNVELGMVNTVMPALSNHVLNDETTFEDHIASHKNVQTTDETTATLFTSQPYVTCIK
ncbi:cyclin-D-binding Myb-like transcription factor 1 isoform X2 [Hydractinia symbiolongicarpus]|uniref:cyclin-D-binding Myb-like transcription factor 1 isoform X2 n=1 Tax=Hydractinia symbiolongicarpus TaxID=13093 RepID=UPI00254FA36C|nr:cyclin-D-binding Myb-like transcription factor 1 isoform X2 [Hydractinia symbiolongicarpus]